jgi:transposase-like protein
MKQIRYNSEQRQAAVAQMGAPLYQPIKALAKAIGITEVTLRTWRREAIEAGQLIRRDPGQSERWSGAEKFRIVLESAPMNAAELSEYARKQGVLPEQIARWRIACEKANAPATGALAKPLEARQAEQRMQALERELQRKDAALAETAALLVLQKKARAIWGTDEDA